MVISLSKPVRAITVTAAAVACLISGTVSNATPAAAVTTAVTQQTVNTALANYNAAVKKSNTLKQNYNTKLAAKNRAAATYRTLNSQAAAAKKKARTAAAKRNAAKLAENATKYAKTVASYDKAAKTAYTAYNKSLTQIKTTKKTYDTVLKQYKTANTVDIKLTGVRDLPKFVYVKSVCKPYLNTKAVEVTEIIKFTGGTYSIWEDKGVRGIVKANHNNDTWYHETTYLVGSKNNLPKKINNGAFVLAPYNYASNSFENVQKQYLVDEGYYFYYNVKPNYDTSCTSL